MSRKPRTKNQITSSRPIQEEENFKNNLEPLEDNSGNGRTAAAEIYDTHRAERESDKPPRSRRMSEETRAIVDALIDVGHTDTWIAKHVGVDFTAVALRRQRRERNPEVKDIEDEAVREDNRNRFIHRAYELAFKLLKEANDPQKLKEASLKEIVTSLGIVMDKILVASGRFDETETTEWAQIKNLGEDELDKFIEQTQGTYQLLVGRKQRSRGQECFKTNAESS